MKNKRYIVAWEEKYPAFIADIFARAICEYPEIIGNNIANYYSFIEKNNHGITFYSEEAQERIDKEHCRYFLKTENVDKLILDHDTIILDHKNFFIKFKKLKLSKISDNELKIFWDKFERLTIKTAAYFRTTRPEFEIEINKHIKKILSKNYHNSEIDDRFVILASSPKIGLIKREKKDWIRLLKTKEEKNDFKNNLYCHIEKYPSFFVNIYNINKIFKSLHNKYNKDKKVVSKLEEEIKEDEKRLKLFKKEQLKIYQKCNNRKLETFSKILQEFGWYRFELKNIWAGIEIKYLLFFNEISIRHDIDLHNLLDYYTLEEIKKLIKNRKKINQKEINERKKCFSLVVENRKYKILTGNKAQKLLKIINKNLIIDKNIKGNIAFKGKVVGCVKIILLDACKTKNIKKGEILVTTNTQPSMLSLMHKAAAFVSDIGGITSHTAIVAREMKKPCIIGTKIATKVLKDGDLVEVDADKGIVKILKRK